MSEDDSSEKPQGDSVNIKKTGGTGGKALNSRVVGSGLLLFLDYILVAIGGWLFWIVVSRLVSVVEIGVATTIYSLVVTVATITQLGAEYPLLMKSHTDRSVILGTGLVIQVAISIASVPFVVMVVKEMYEGSLQEYTWIAVILIILIAVEFVTRFVLLGVFNAKKVLTIDMLGLSLKFVVAYVLLSIHYGALGILFAFLSEFLIIAVSYLFFAKKTFAFHIGKISFFKEVLMDSLINAPSKWSNVMIINLSIVLLAFIGVNQGDIGIFYITLMISVVVGSFASSMAFMVIPAFSESKKDLSSGSLRISLGTVTPVLSVMLVAPDLVLSLMNPEYEAGAALLFVLTIGVIPFSITVNAIAKLNNLKERKKLFSIGILQLIVFIVSFFLFAPSLGTIGAAYAILIAFTGSAIVSLIWSDKSSLRHIAYCCLAVFVSTISGYAVYLVARDALISHPQIFAIITSLALSIVVTIGSKNVSITELRYLVREAFRKNRLIS
jgi:O-antigen/teichoic acid export membrane protein